MKPHNITIIRVVALLILYSFGATVIALKLGLPVAFAIFCLLVAGNIKKPL